MIFVHPVFHAVRRDGGILSAVENLHLSQCYGCNWLTVWVGDRVLWPQCKKTHEPSPDLPADVRSDFLEADSIYEVSPRGAAALLRLAIQKLCTNLTNKRSLNEAIADLVKQGLPEHVQQALDVVRVIGNNAVHPGELDIRDDTATVASLFRLVNMIASYAISDRRAAKELFAGLPQPAQAAVAKRDA